ncbi:MAG TPA: LPS export ABC transporter permease LptF [Candidatus Thioglobus sp.]|nr:LPS export ABC transporter permease LptF [Candidatus Thioglobus sp.]
MLLEFFSFKTTKIAKYIMRNLVAYFCVITFIIGLVVFGNQFVLTVQESIDRGIPFQELMPLISFNMIRDVPVILVLSIFLAVIITISQLYKNSEAIVMNSIGLGDKAFLSVIKPLAIILFLFVLFLTAYAVPWAKQQKSAAEEETKNASEFSFITEGKFESFKKGDIVFYASESTSIDVDGMQNMEEIFIYASENGNPVIVLASDAKKYIDPKSKSIYLRLRDGVRYQGLPSSENINILNFDSYDLEIVSGEVQKSIATFTEIEEKTTLDLLKQGGLLAIAELQWRLSLPLSILILVVFAVYLGKTSPRGGKGINILIGIFVFMLYNNGLLVAKSSIENGLLSPIIGMWGIHLIAILFLMLLYQFRQGKIMYFIDKITIFNNKKKSHV